MAYEFILTVSRPNTDVPFYFDSEELANQTSDDLFTTHNVSRVIELSPDQLVCTRKYSSATRSDFLSLVAAFDARHTSYAFKRNEYCRQHGHDLISNEILENGTVNVVNIV